MKAWPILNLKKVEWERDRNSYSKVYLFTEDDLNHFQAIADKKSSLGLESAILSAYGFSKENDSQKPIRELVDELEVSFKEIQERLSKEPSKVETGVRSASG